MQQEGGVNNLRISGHASVDKAVVIDHVDHVSLGGGELKQRRRPLQTPRDIPEFTGRQEVIRQIEESIDSTRDAPAVWVLSGMAGVGKTSIAIRASHAFADRFPDGILYANLAGASVKPVEATEILTRFLRDLGISVGDLPGDYESLTTAYRTLIATKAILVVLDDAADTAQVNDIIPTSPTSAALITSRRPLTALPGARSIPIDVWPLEDCARFLRVLLGAARMEESTEEVNELAEKCGRLPIALRIIGAQLIRRPLWPLSRMVTRLQDEQRRLEVLRADDIEIRSVFATAYDSLTPEQARIFHMVGLTLGATFSVESVAQMAAIDDYDAEVLLEDLADRHLISPEDIPGRYRVHDLMRLFAKEKSGGEEWIEEREESVRRLLEWHLRVLESDSPSIRTWVRLEKESLVAGVLISAELELNEICWKTANALAQFHSMESDYNNWITCNRAGLDAARKCMTAEGQALMLGGLGQASRELENFSDARSYLQGSLELFREIGDPAFCAHVLWEIGKTASSQWDVASAISAYTESVQIAKSIASPYSVARGLHALGHLYSGIGRHDEALECFEEELRLASENNANSHHYGLAYQGMAACLAASGMAQQSTDAYDKSIAAAREGGDFEGLRVRLTRKAKVLETLGRTTEANSAYQEALDLARNADDSAFIWARHHFADSLARQGELDRADALFLEVLDSGDIEDDPEGFIAAMHCWGDSYAKRGNPDRAIELLDGAVSAARRCEREEDLVDILICRSRVERDRGIHSAGIPFAQEAVGVARSYGSARALAKCLGVVGDLLEKLEKPREAADAYGEQVRLEVLMQQWDSASESAERLSSIWGQLGEPVKSEEYAVNAREYSTRGSLPNTEKSNPEPNEEGRDL
ncbi:tetratricopeptide repeat protein [Streptomyces sp. NBC_00572]|uniref:ATP-binding protein n=1 Tax=Streptomyces sp. NBC_00572 TaxID=2903664 RepID=UPI002254D6E9|nr:tetratricopeptide repeat protein [Streptomyces sp. NBC_00572]MCX4981490.1 tetratricopeptide repeat protein [Streptomyces sp. NBC_00572]